MTYAAKASLLELDVHVQVCWVPRTKEEHVAATGRIEDFAQRSGNCMQSVLP
jgi:hypothetical protein